MYGQIHVCVRSLVLRQFGEDAWKKILEVSGADDIDDFLVFHRYPDEKTLKLVGAVSEVSGIEVTTVLEVFGEYFLQYCMDVGYDKMLRTLGEDFRSFIQNLDSLHSLLAMTYKNIDAPSFRCEPIDDEGNMFLHYYSARPGLHPIVTGLLRAVGTKLFNINVESEVIDISELMANGRVQHHVKFKVKGVLGNAKKEAANNSQERTEIAIPNDTIITASTFCNIFPFHIVYDSSLTIKQCGVNIQKMAYLEGFVGRQFDDVFELCHPRMPLTYDHILNFIMANYVLEVKAMKDNDSRYSKLVLKGQMIHMGDIGCIIFIGSPRLESLNEMQERNMYLSDIPLYDVTRELILLNQQRIAEIEVSKKLDEASAELKRLTCALDIEKKKTDALLYQMLPQKIAEQLRDGLKVAAEKFDQVTIFFSDIVTFTNIAAAVKPLDIVSMLNELYSRLDLLTTTHDVYKVETIGDAYMVVGGVPEISEIHADRVANFAIDMVEKSREVLSPATGNPIQVRVGLHSGSVVAGVVGDKMPRYCLFGDTVNTASRMESHGVPGRIHCSPTTYNHLKDKNYRFIPRGEIEVKGKGKMPTYFLKANPHKEAIWYDENNEKEPGVDDQARSAADGANKSGSKEILSDKIGKSDEKASKGNKSRPSSAESRSSKSKSSTCRIV